VIKQCKTCFAEWEVATDGTGKPEYVYFHICKGKPKDFLIGEIVEEMKEIESS
jgi:hypothetical protein